MTNNQGNKPTPRSASTIGGVEDVEEAFPFAQDRRSSGRSRSANGTRATRATPVRSPRSGAVSDCWIVDAGALARNRRDVRLEEEFCGKLKLEDPGHLGGGSRLTERGSFPVLGNSRKAGVSPGEKRREDTAPRKAAWKTRPNDLLGKCSLRRYYSILTNATGDLPSLRRSSSVQTLPLERAKRSPCRVKKSVSFSSDTSFVEKRAPFRRAAVHEAKVYRKGVLQDHSARDAFAGKVPSPCEEVSEGGPALLRAARDADEKALGEIAARARRFGFRDAEVNAVDASGRTAVSYMAGNGASTMLELILSCEGVDPNIPDNEGNTPLHFAAQAGQTECLNVLLQRCPDIEVDARNACGFTPLMKAALQGRIKCAKILLFAGANPTLRDHGRGLRAEQWARFCGRYVCAEVIERFARHRLLERSTSCRWGSEPELAAKILQGKVMPVPSAPLSPPCSTGIRSKIRNVFRTTSGPARNFSLVSQLTSAALCASSPALPKASDVPPVVKSLLRPLSVPQLRVTLVPPQDFPEQSRDKCGAGFSEKIDSSVGKPARSKKKAK